ncbi:MAG TPA: rhamnulokinase family protein [Candidatus Limnocylindrales bacterium]
MSVHAAVDLGASSGRVMLASVSADAVSLKEVARFDNVPVMVNGTLHWDILRLYRGVLEGLRAAGSFDSVGVDSWGVDFGLLDADGNLLGNPVHYRDSRTSGLAQLDLYAETGIQHLPFNTVYQLLAAQKSAQFDAARTLLLIPDLISYWLTGEVGAEVTNASTTQLLDVHTRRWHSGILGRVGLSASLLPPLRDPGTVIGPLLPSTGLDPARVVAVGSHDTASAVVGVPAASERFGYISCGTWSLVGVELPSPVVTDEAREANFTNEAGVGGTVRFLRNVMGLWLLQESLRAWPSQALSGLLEAAATLPASGPVFDPDDPVFLPPGDMPARIVAACGGVPMEPPAIVRSILDSLALAHARALADAQRLSGTAIEVVHVVGGGVHNELLCQLTADACGLPVLAGPVEATALGNALIQAGLDLPDARALLRATQQIKRYNPRVSRWAP